MKLYYIIALCCNLNLTHSLTSWGDVSKMYLVSTCVSIIVVLIVLDMQHYWVLNTPSLQL